MNKLLFHTLSLSVIALSTTPVLSNQPIPTQPKQPQSFISWISQAIFKKEPPIRPRKGGSRPTVRNPNDICMISPDKPETTRIVWSDRPLFIWQGQVNKIVLLNKNTGKKWTQPVTETQNISTYTGDEPLQPGQTYEWRVFFEDSLSKEELSSGVNFQVMEAQQSDRITADLQILEKQLKAENKDTEAIALAKAKYFAENQLWSDVLQQVYSVQFRSDELQKTIKNIDKLCDLPNLSGNNSLIR
ncbi:hypothetical protein CDG77_11505 [Nostoc sp. 'Peltigera membranacea cyanobiont' 213]|uniref:DUF928 domain-containing protein n=1 Tax=Nostoc sp. 'Peltigera membranacea cyanobiont' 213 TaxID=2014530 RepID=UPI000B958192|nr:DUF928 domain-containing protein [Nostoc sp. 'Peltigera membranacea cyanobiont' 213]OYD94983.1 hypothetical protein CDG77_11505 [Nostoc sp. 'Peltigera membranacea cyanobiont' 213]